MKLQFLAQYAGMKFHRYSAILKEVVKSESKLENCVIFNIQPVNINFTSVHETPGMCHH